MLSSEQRVLIVSNNPFYGGGESFVVSTLSNINALTYYIVACTSLKDQLPVDRSEFFSSSDKCRQIRQVRQAIKRIQPDVVVLNGGSTLFFAPFIRAQKVFYKHTTNLATGNSRFKRAIYIAVQQFLFLFVGKVIHVSRYSLDEQIIKRNKASFVHHGLEPKPYRAKEVATPVQFLFVGRTEKTKGLDIIVDTFLSIDPNQARLHIVGAGEMAPYLETLNHPNIVYHGFQSDVGRYYLMSDVLVTLPLYEAFGLTIIEAMNHSLPVVACAVGAVPELIDDGVNGFLIDRTPHALEQLVHKIVAQPELLTPMSQAASQTIHQRFDLQRTIEKIETIII